MVKMSLPLTEQEARVVGPPFRELAIQPQLIPVLVVGIHVAYIVPFEILVVSHLSLAHACTEGLHAFTLLSDRLVNLVV